MSCLRQVICLSLSRMSFSPASSNFRRRISGLWVFPNPNLWGFSVCYLMIWCSIFSSQNFGSLGVRLLIVMVSSAQPSGIEGRWGSLWVWKQAQDACLILTSTCSRQPDRIILHQENLTLPMEAKVKQWPKNALFPHVTWIVTCCLFSLLPWFHGLSWMRSNKDNPLKASSAALRFTHGRSQSPHTGL